MLVRIAFVLLCTRMANAEVVPCATIEEAISKILGHPAKTPYLISVVREQLHYAGLSDRPGAPQQRAWLCLEPSGAHLQADVGYEIGIEVDPEQRELQLRWSALSGAQLFASLKQANEAVATVDIRLAGHPHQIFTIDLEVEEERREQSWEMAGHSVDSRLLMRMDGRWFGEDKLSSEQSDAQGIAHHLQFGFGQRAYSIAPHIGGSMYWCDGRWHVGAKDDAPIAKLEAADSAKLTLVCWDASGFYRTELSMPKLFSPGNLTGLASQIRLKGLRGQRRAQLNLGNHQLICRPGDWLVKQGDSWKVLSSKEAQDRWRKECNIGEVIRVESIERKKGKPRVVIRLYNPSHTEASSQELTGPGAIQPLGGQP